MTSATELQQSLVRTWAGRSTPVLAGNVGDLHIGADQCVMGLEQFLASTAALTGRSFVQWSPGRGTVPHTPPGRSACELCGPGPDDVADGVTALMAALDRCSEPVVVALDWLCGGQGRGGELPITALEALASALTDPQLAQRDHRFVIIDRFGNLGETVGRLPSTRRIVVPFPDGEDRSVVLDLLLRRSGDASEREACLPLLVSASAGLPLRRLAALCMEASHEGRLLDRRAIESEKRDHLVERTEGALRLLTGSAALEDLAGFSNIRLLINEHLATGVPLRNLVLAGPPGVGKSTVVAALARALGMAAVALGDVRSPYVGESERRLRTTMETATALAPVIVFIDEIDQILAGDDGPTGDSGVTSRLNAMLWEWTGAVGAEQGVLVVGATNRPRALGNRMADRFTTIPVLNPDAEEGADILALAAARDGRSIDRGVATTLLRARGTAFSGRTLVELYRNAVIAGSLDGHPPVHLDATLLQAAADDLLRWPDPREQQFMALDAVRSTRIRRYLPWEAARRLGRPYEVPAYLQGIVRADGSIDAGALDRAMNTLVAP